MLPRGVKGRVGVARGRRGGVGGHRLAGERVRGRYNRSICTHTICTAQAFIKVYAACTTSQASALTHAAHLPLPLPGESLDIAMNWFAG